VNYLLDFLTSTRLQNLEDTGGQAPAKPAKPPLGPEISAAPPGQAPGETGETPDAERRRVAVTALADDPEALAEREAIQEADRQPV
jgi:hypothetical protein